MLNMITLTKILSALALALFACSQSAAQQLTLQTDYLEICRWNGKAGKFDECSALPVEGIFEFNAQGTQVRHLAEDGSSIFTIRESKYEPESDLWEYQVASSNGTRYVIIRDGKNDLIKILTLSAGSKNNYVLLSHHVSNQVQHRAGQIAVPITRTAYHQ